MLAQVVSSCCSKHLIDINNPLTQSCTVESCDFDQDAFWHSSAHILGYALELNYLDAKLAHGPPIDQGFFYDFGTASKVTESDYERLERDIEKIIKSKLKFERLVLTKEQALDMFQEN